MTADLDAQGARRHTPSGRSAYRDLLRATALGLANRIQDAATGADEVVRLEDRHLMGPGEQVGHLATQPGYVVIHVVGRSHAEVVRQVLTKVFGPELDDLDIAEHAPAAAERVLVELCQSAAAAGLNTAFMVDARTGERRTMRGVAYTLVEQASDRLTGGGRAITEDRLVKTALGLLGPNAFPSPRTQESP